MNDLEKTTTIKVKKRTLRFFNFQKLRENCNSQDEFVHSLLKFFVNHKNEVTKK